MAAPRGATMKNLRRMLAGVLLTVLIAAQASAATTPDIVYLDRCSGGCNVQPGADDAVNGKSSVISTSVVLAGFAYSTATFDATAACVRHVLAPWNIIVRIDGPGSVPRRQVMMTASSAASVGLPAGVPAVSPVNGHPIDNAIAFVFASTVGANVDDLCWTSAQAIGNLYGLDFVSACPDVMSTAAGCGIKAFTDQDAACVGVLSGVPGKCILGNTVQNSAAMLGAVPGATDILFANGVENFQQPATGPSP